MRRLAGAEGAGKPLSIDRRAGGFLSSLPAPMNPWRDLRKLPGHVWLVCTADFINRAGTMALVGGVLQYTFPAADASGWYPVLPASDV